MLSANEMHDMVKKVDDNKSQTENSIKNNKAALDKSIEEMRRKIVTDFYFHNDKHEVTVSRVGTTECNSNEYMSGLSQYACGGTDYCIYGIVCKQLPTALKDA
jgi:hypothetical protein